MFCFPKAFKRAATILFFSCFLFAFSLIPRAEALTFIEDGYISEDTIWTKAQSPYVVSGSIYITPEATLIIESGVTVKFENGSAVVAGKLVAEGAPEEKIYFTSNYDDTAGGTTDFCVEGFCEDLLDPYEGDWGGFVFVNSAGSILENVVIRYAETGAQLADGANADFKDLEIADSVFGILVQEKSQVKLAGGEIHDLSDSAVFVYNGSSLELSRVKIKDIFRDAVYVMQSSNLTATDFSLENVATGVGVYIFDESSFEAEKFSITGTNLYAFNNSILVLKNSSFKNCPDDSCVFVFDNQPVAGPTDVLIENTVFGGGLGSGIFTFDGGYGDLNIDVKNSSFDGFDLYAIESYADFTIRAENNWWGDTSGPYHETLNPAGTGEAFLGNVDFEPWCESADCSSRNPILIVPGILGTEIFNGPEKLWMDFWRIFWNIGDQFSDALALRNNFTPINNGLSLGDVIKTLSVDIVVGDPVIFDYSGSLMEEFQKQRYVEGADLFTFPYDWRFGEAEINIENLKQKIAEVLDLTQKNKVDVIAHSNGGLLVKKYVVENSAEHHIGKAVFVGVPNTGAPKAVKGLIVGDSFGNPFLSPDEMKKLARNFPVAYDLLPSQQYYDSKGSYVRVVEDRLLNPDEKDLNFKETNEFLLGDHNLNSQALNNAQALHTKNFDNYDMRSAGIDLYNIVGCKAGTIGKITERRIATTLGGAEISYIELTEIPGDGTVPLESATNLPMDDAKRFFALKASHATMMTQNGIRQQIVNILSGSALSTEDIITQDINECELNGRAIAIYSPISIDIKDQNGNHLGLASDGVSTENNILNADFEIMGEHKFVYLPENGSRNYEINLQGTGVGTFTIINSEIKNNETVQEQEFKDIPVTAQTQGEIVLNPDTQEPELKLDVTGDGVVDFIIPPNDEFDPVLYLQIMKTTINSLDLPLIKKKILNARIDRIIKMVEKGKINRAELKAERFKAALERKIAKPDWVKPKPRKLSKTDAQLLLDMLNKLLDNLE